MCNLLIALIVVRSSNQASLFVLMFSSDVIRLQECYEACLSLNLEDFSLSASIDEEEEESAGDDKSLFLEYDRQLMIMARIANFDKAAHRYGCRHTFAFYFERSSLYRLSNKVLHEQKEMFQRNRTKLGAMAVRGEEIDKVPQARRHGVGGVF